MKQDHGMKQTSKKYAAGQSPRERIINAARTLFGAKGFHATTTAELAADASVSMGQIYRHFTAKDEIVLAIVEENAEHRVAEMHAIFDAVERGEQTMFEAIKAITEIALHNEGGGLLFEIVAEAWRNPSVAERLNTLTAFYRTGVRRLAELARPDLPASELDGYADIMMACFIGLGHRPAIAPCTDVEKASHTTATLMMRSLGLTEDKPSPGK
jgi:TetR/AcrR family transcriptional repressor of uid operon